MAKIIIKWKSAFFGAACKFDVYLMNTYIGELKWGGTLETSVEVGMYMLVFKEKRMFGKKVETAFKVVVNEDTEFVELRTKFDMNGNFIVKYADNAPHIPTYSGATQSNMEYQTNIFNEKSNMYSKCQKTNSGCLGGCFAVIIIVIAINLIVPIMLRNSDVSYNNTTIQTEQYEQIENVLYFDDNFKITFIDFKDPNLGVTSYNLLLKIENNSDKTVIVSPSDGYANDEAVFLGSGMPVTVNPDKKVTGVFLVGYGNTSIKSIDDIDTLEMKITLYDENFSEKILTTGDIFINLK